MTYRGCKRVFDILLSLLGILLSSPIWIITMIGIYLSDPGPVFYPARRIGKDDMIFVMYKFRSMRQGKANEFVFRGDEDRIFPFGRFIRATKIDELPQLLNIFLGTMSIVGPRPAAVDQYDVVREGKYHVASKVAGGLTGPSALYDYIYGDSVEDEDSYRSLVLPTRLDLDVYYVEHMSLFFDIKMIWYTVVCIISSIVKIKPKKILIELISYVEKETIDE